MRENTATSDVTNETSFMTGGYDRSKASAFPERRAARNGRLENYNNNNEPRHRDYAGIYTRHVSSPHHTRDGKNAMMGLRPHPPVIRLSSVGASSEPEPGCPRHPLRTPAWIS